MIQVLTKFVAFIFVPNIHYIVTKLSWKRFSGMKDEKTIKYLFLSSKTSTFFHDLCFQYYLTTQVSEIANILAFCGQLSIVCSLPLQLRHLFFS